MKKNLNAFLLALTFLTRLPLPSPVEPSPDVFSLALGYMPTVGLLIGAICGVWIAGSAFLFQNALLAALSGLVFGLVLTGALHEDGLADCADGMLGGYTKEQRLEIMKDSRHGTYGVIALWSILTAELLLISCLLKENFWEIILPLTITNGLGRVSQLTLATYLSYARVGPSRSASFFQSPSTSIFLLGSLPVIILTVLLLHRAGVFCLAAWGIVTLASGWYFREKIGGITGDCLGTASKLTQIACYLAIFLSNRVPIAHHLTTWPLP